MHSLSSQLLQEHRLVLGCVALAAASWDSSEGWPIPAAEGGRDECGALESPSGRHLCNRTSGKDYGDFNMQAVLQEVQPR